MGHDDVFAGLPIQLFTAKGSLIEPSLHAIKVMWEWESEVSFTQLFDDLLAEPNAKAITALVIGAWDEELYDVNSSAVVDLLVAAKDKLPQLKALFMGDISQEENEISWINQSNLEPLYAAYPQLEVLKVRGGNDLQLGDLRQLPKLHTLIIETGGLDRSVIEDITRHDLSQLKHLELWLGSEDYGANINIYDFEALLSGELFPSLKYLGIRNSENADELAPVIASSPLLLRLDTLDMSLGNLSDQGGEVFLKSSALGKLKLLDLHHHYLSEDMMQRLAQLPMTVNLDEQEVADDWGDGELHRYIYVSE